MSKKTKYDYVDGSIKITRPAEIVVTCAAFPKTTKEGRMEIILDVERYLNEIGFYDVDTESLGIIRIGIRVHIK